MRITVWRFILPTTAILLLGPRRNLRADPHPDQQLRALKRLHKEELKSQKAQQKAMRKVLAQHELTAASRRRLKHNLKMQHDLLRKEQRHETRRLKMNRTRSQHRHFARPAKRSHLP